MNSSIAQKVMDKIDGQGYNWEEAIKVCLEYYGFMMYQHKPVKEVPPDKKYVWRIYVFTDYSLVYLFYGGMAVFDDKRPPVPCDILSGPILVSAINEV